MELSEPQIKKHIFLKETCSYISGNRNPKKILIFQEVSFQAQKMKINHSEKKNYISGNRTF